MPWTISRSPRRDRARRATVEHGRASLRAAGGADPAADVVELERSVTRRPLRRSDRGATVSGSGSRSGPAPGVMAPRTRASRAPVQPGIAPGSPCAVCQPMSAKQIASLVSVGAPNSLVSRHADARAGARASIAIRVGLSQPPPEQTRVSTPCRRRGVRDGPRGQRGQRRDQVRARQPRMPCPERRDVGVVEQLLAGRPGRRQRVVRLGQQVREQRPRPRVRRRPAAPSAS